ncbi:hypothetical protein ABZX62_07585 [Streptomyces flavidovirens]|uniref:hypothetical protein n=1 Tax=Streptomyces flavidovirens TaxID=67298 RepID=UPI0033BA3AFE
MAHAEAQLSSLEARKRELGDVLSPDLARRKVFDEAVSAMNAGGSFPDGIGAIAARAYLDALVGESEALALRVGVDSLRSHLRCMRETEAEAALEALGKRLVDFLSEVRKVAADLKGARSADEAIQAGGRAPAAWKTLTDMVGRLRAIREAQFDTLRPLGDGQRLQQLRDAGHFELAGLRHDEVPADILTALQSGYYDVPSLVYLANSGSAWVPSSYEALEDEDVMPDVGIPDGPVRDLNPAVTSIPEPPAPKPTGAERAPVLQH